MNTVNIKKHADQLLRKYVMLRVDRGLIAGRVDQVSKTTITVHGAFRFNSSRMERQPDNQIVQIESVRNAVACDELGILQFMLEHLEDDHRRRGDREATAKDAR